MKVISATNSRVRKLQIQIYKLHMSIVPVNLHMNIVLVNLHMSIVLVNLHMSIVLVNLHMSIVIGPTLHDAVIKRLYSLPRVYRVQAISAPA